MTERDEALLTGLLIGEGHFGGDGKAPQVTVRMHVRHERLFHWLVERLPRSKLYGPYHHGDRHYFQWMCRGECLLFDLLPVLERHLTPEVDTHAYARVQTMLDRYTDYFAGIRARAAVVAALPQDSPAT